MANDKLIEKIKRIAKLKRELTRLTAESASLSNEIDTLIEGLNEEDRETAEKILDLMRKSSSNNAQLATLGREFQVTVYELGDELAAEDEQKAQPPVQA